MKQFLFLISILLTVPGLAKNIYDLKINSLEGKPISLAQYKGKVLLIVNTASQCGYTPQLKTLQDLQEKYQKQGLQVLAFPSNDFKQDRGSNEETLKFSQEKYHVTFPLFDKASVAGPQKQEIYQILTEALPSVPKEVQWNFEKFLVDRQGQVKDRFRSSTAPDDKQVIAAIEKLLQQK